jgi:hypothetical protein
MADDNFVRSYRSSSPAQRPSTPSGARDAGAKDDVARSDPLAELARLIGQTDPFTDPAQQSGPNADQDDWRHTRENSAPAPRVDSGYSDWRQTAAALARESMRASSLADSPDEYAEEAVPEADSYRAGLDDHFAQPTEHDFAHPTERVALNREGEANRHYQDGPRYEDGPHFGATEDRLQAAPPGDRQAGEGDDEQYFFDGEETPADDRFYDDPPHARRGNGLVTTLVLIGCAMAGTAGAYGYRTYYSGSRSTDAPIISADRTPSKVVPVATADAQAGKSAERIGEKNAEERVVPRQEEPVTLPASNTPRVVPPPLVAPPGAKAAAPGVAAPASGPTEPKKVQTIAIKPEGSDTLARPLVSPGSPSSQAMPAPPAASTRPSGGAKPAAQPGRGNGIPLSLEPRAQPSEAVSAYQPAPREAAVPAASGPRLASASATGGYVVQISSQRSEAEAQASFRSLQAKYPKELGDREAIVRRADLGPMGIHYRAMVGPFESAGDANQFCSGLKAAGGNCIVQKN